MTGILRDMIDRILKAEGLDTRTVVDAAGSVKHLHVVVGHRVNECGEGRVRSGQ